jgi:hypothetical protein
MLILETFVLLLLLTAVSAVPEDARELRMRVPIPQQVPIPRQSESQYYTLRRDYRECLSPLFGGYFVQALNQQSTLCYNRELSGECYVAALDLSNVN